MKSALSLTLIVCLAGSALPLSAQRPAGALASTPGLRAGSARVRRTWDELARMLPGMNIRMILPDGTVIRGKALDVRRDEDDQTPSGRAGSIQLHAPAELLVLVADEFDDLIVG